MKTILTFSLFLITILGVAQSNVRLLSVDTETHQVTLKNFGNVSQNIGTHWLCSFPNYEQINSLVKVSGVVNLTAGSSITVIFEWAEGAAGEVAYYNNGTFASATGLKSYMEYGAGGHEREGLAVTNNLWTAGAFVAGDPIFQYTGNGTEAGVSFWTSQVEGCTYETACNFDPAATKEDGTCEFTSCEGCIYPGHCNFDPSATIDDGSCETISCGGCTEPHACNYDVSASIDDGSCEFTSCAGCTAPCAANFDPAKTIDDGSCDYSTCGAAASCAGDLDNNELINTADLLIFMGAFGTTCE